MRLKMSKCYWRLKKCRLNRDNGCVEQLMILSFNHFSVTILYAELHLFSLSVSVFPPQHKPLLPLLPPHISS